jgi:hypothetical protein
MKNLSIAVLAALSLLSFAGCKKKGGADVTAKMAEFRDQMCKCTDKACADKVMESMTKWTQENAKAGGDKEAAKPTEEDMKKTQAISEEYTKCMQKVMTASMPPPPAAPTGDKPADPAAAPPPAGDKPADPAAAPPAGDKPADKPAAGSN